MQDDPSESLLLQPIEHGQHEPTRQPLASKFLLGIDVNDQGPPILRVCRACQPGQNDDASAGNHPSCFGFGQPP